MGTGSNCEQHWTCGLIPSRAGRARFPSGHAPALPIGVFWLANPRLRHPRWVAVPPISPQKILAKLPAPYPPRHRPSRDPRLYLRDADAGSLARPGRVRPAGCRPHRGTPPPSFPFGALQAVSATTTHSLSASSLRPSHVGKPSTSWFHHGHPPVAPRPPLHWPAPDPPDWTAPLFLTNCSARCKSRWRSRVAHPSFFFSHSPPSLPVIQPQVAQYRFFFGPVLSFTISGRAIYLVIRLFKPHPRRRDKPVRRQPCSPIDIDQRTTARLH